MDIFGVCPDCKEPNTGLAWCKKCDPGKFLKEGKTSGIPEIDNLIHESQLKTKYYSCNLEWIPYYRFQDIKLIGEGGFANIFSATWLDGEPIQWIETKKHTKPIRVALKKLKNSKNMEAFINEIKIHDDCSNHSYFPFTKFYGITKDPQTEELMMVLEYAENDNLRKYLKNE